MFSPVIVILTCITLSACLVGCYPGMVIEPVPVRSASPFPVESVLAPITFETGTTHIRRGTLVGTYRDGFVCTNGGEKVHWMVNSYDDDLLKIPYSDLFHEQFSAAGYTVIGDPQKLFEEG